jgi:hypothetical protein
MVQFGSGSLTGSCIVGCSRAASDGVGVVARLCFGGKTVNGS